MSRGSWGSRGVVVVFGHDVVVCVGARREALRGQGGAPAAQRGRTTLMPGAERRRLSVDDVVQGVSDVSRHLGFHTVSPWFVRAGSSAAEACLRRPESPARMVWSSSQPGGLKHLREPQP